MSLPRGPVRIVLLRSGGYDYADLELHAPLHLVAANNVGKTTLIAALQFLYIDDARQMHFSHDFSETRKHYFPHAGSAVLFECMTPTGFQVFGLRGLGPVQGHEYERFVYAGPYDRADYVDGCKVRPWDEVARRLVGRNLAVLEPRHLRASLTGSGDAKGPPLGLVPLKRSGSYESFRFLFRNLLFKSLVEGVDEVRREVSRLTQALGRRQISNLERVELELVKQHDLLRRLNAVIDAEAAPLFAGPDGRSRAARDIESWLEDRPRIELAELFDLGFRVIDRNGQTKTFDSLTQIESQGTSITIKVLVHLELLKKLLSDEPVAVPFFLDEVAALDERNLRGLVDRASAMGFVPVVASPEARDCVETLYFLRASQGGLVLDETSRVLLRRETHDGT